MKFYSEYGEDKWIVENLPLPIGSPYIDIGAMRPDVNSNTAFLRDLGASGLVIDGHPDCARWWKGLPMVENQSCLFRCEVLAGNQDEVTFAHGGPGHEPESRILPMMENVAGWITTRRQALTLETVLHRERMTTSLGLLSIDIEGKEFEVMEYFDFGYWRPQIIVAEYNTLGIGKDYRLMELILATGDYSVVHQTTANLIFQRRK